MLNELKPTSCNLTSPYEDTIAHNTTQHNSTDTPKRPHIYKTSPESSTQENTTHNSFLTVRTHKTLIPVPTLLRKCPSI